MDLLTPEQLANFAKKYNRLVASYLLYIFFAFLAGTSLHVMKQGENDILALLCLLQFILTLGFLIYSLFVAAATGKAANSSAVRKNSDYFILFTVAVFVLPFSPLANLTNIIGLIAFCFFIRLLNSCVKRFKEHHVQIGLFVRQENLKTALYTEEEIQNAGPLSRRTWGGYFKSRACMLIGFIIFISIISSYYECIKTLPKTPTFEMTMTMAQNGDSQAQNTVGEAYYNGEVVEKNNDEAFAWFKKAAENGNAEGMYNLAICYRDGIGTEVDIEQAFHYCQMAAEQDFPPAICAMGICLVQGNGVPKDEEKGKELIQKAADMGYSP